jgi:hypothetical protein
MKRLVLGSVLAAGAGIFVQGQTPAKPSLSITADTMGQGSDGRAVFTGAVVMVIDGTQVTTDSGALYNLATGEIELGEGKVRIKLAGGPRQMNFQARGKR